MIKIAMLGCDSSHTEAYSELLHKKESAFFGKARVEWLWGEDINQAKTKAKLCGIKNVVNVLDDPCLDEADMFMIMGRYGDSHFLPAMRALKTLKPTYIDKPFTNNLMEAEKILHFVRDKQVSLMSFSPLRFAKEVLEVKAQLKSHGNLYGAIVSGPANTNLIPGPRAQQLHFYGIHAVDILCSLFGTNVNKIKAEKSNIGIWVILTYSDGKHASLNLPYNKSEFYQFTLFGQEKESAVSINPYETFYEETMKVLLNELFRGDCKKAPIEEAYTGILILDAIVKSIDTQSEIIINEKI